MVVVACALSLVIASGLPLWVAAHRVTYLNDDSYISLTYAKSLAQGQGFVYNHPPATLGTTTPLFTFIVAGLGAAFRSLDMAVLATAFTALCWIGAAWCFFLFHQRLGISVIEAWTVALCVLAFGWVDNLGMEAYLFSVLLVAAVVLHTLGRWATTGFLVGLLFLTRGEGAMLIGVFACLHVVRCLAQRQFAPKLLFGPLLRLVAGFAVPVLAWGIYAQLTFGKVLPNTLTAKMGHLRAGLGPPFVRRLFQEWMPIWERQLRFGEAWRANAWYVAAAIGLYVACARRQALAAFPLWGLVYTAGYSLIGVAAAGWYGLPVHFVLTILAGLGMGWILTKLLENRHPLARWLTLPALAVLVLALGCTASTRTQAVRARVGDSRGPSYTALAEWFNTHADPTESIAYVEIGYLGYFTENRIIDLLGLTLPDVATHVARGDLVWGFRRYRPDYVVYLPEFDWLLGDIVADGVFRSSYERVAELPGPGEGNLVIYKRAF
jgi:hypothetical protein